MTQIVAKVGLAVLVSNEEKKMKAIMVVLTFCIIMISGIAISSTSIPMQSPMYKCKSSSYHAIGWGWGNTRTYAARRALIECSKRTPQGDTCYVDWCRRIK